MARYIVSFYPGSSGRFVSSVLWNALTDSFKMMKFTEHNSAHNEDLWRTSWDDSSLINNDSNHPDIYSHFRFNDKTEHGILVTHTYPKFELIAERFPDAKIIIIGLSDRVFNEVMGNSLLKNGFDLYLKEFHKESLTLARIKRAFKDVTGKEYEPDNPISVEVMKQIYDIEESLMGASRRKEAEPFIESKVPKDFENRTIVIQYEELFEEISNSYSGLEKLSAFTCTAVNPVVRYNYRAYVNGQEKLIQKNLPWIKQNETKRTH